jgi:hypothetical protein
MPACGKGVEYTPRHTEEVKAKIKTIARHDVYNGQRYLEALAIALEAARPSTATALDVLALRLAPFSLVGRRKWKGKGKRE